MWRNALFATAATMLGLALALFTSVDYLIPFKRSLLYFHGAHMAIYSALLFINLYALYFLIARKLLLKDTGQKLSHVEKQLRSGSIAQDLAGRLSEEQ